MRRLLILVLAALAIAATAAAQPASGPVQIGVRQLWRVADEKQDKVTLVTAPTPGAVIDTGTIAGQALTWVTTTFGTLIGGVLTAWLYKMFRKAGIDLTDAQRARLDDIVVNAMNAGAAAAKDELRGKGQIEVKNAAVAKTVRYVQTYGADTLKALGVDPLAQAAVDVIKARIEKATTDPQAPTPDIFAARPADQQKPAS